MGLLTGTAPPTTNQSSGLLGDVNYHLQLGPLPLDQAKKKAPSRPVSKPGQSLLARALTDVGHAGKTVGTGAAKGVRAVARPVISIASGQGGKAIHDTAQLGANVTGGAGNYLLNAAIANPAKELAADVTHNKRAAINASIASNKNLGLGAKGTALKGGLIKLGGEAAQVASLGVGGASLKGVKGISGAVRAVDKTAVAGAAGTVGNVAANNPKATAKDYGKAAFLGTAAGVALPFAGAAVNKGASKVLQKTAPKLSKEDQQIRAILKGDVVSNRAQNLRDIEKNQSSMTDAQRLAAANGDVGQAGLMLPKAQHDALMAKYAKPLPSPAKTSTSTPVKDIAGARQGTEQGSTTAIEAISKKQPLGESGSVRAPSTNAYVKEQIKLQDKARKAGSPSGLAKVGPEISLAKRKLVDSFAPIEDTLNKSIKAGAKIAPENNIKYQIDRAIRGDTIGAQYIKDNGLAKVIQTAPNTKELDQYLIAKHAADLRKQGIETGRNAEKDAQLVKELGPQYENHAKAVKEYSQNLLDHAVSYGLVSKDLATHLKQKYPNYVPVNRIFSESEQANMKGTSAGAASIGRQTVVQKIKGSTRQIESPLSSLIDKSVQVVKEGERNKAAQILTGYKDLPGNPFQLRELGKDEVVGTKPVISVINNGETHRFETSPEIAAAAKSLNKEQLGLIGKILAAPTRVLRLGATSLNPAFALANVAKDTASAFINSSHPLRASVANPKVFVQALKAASNHSGKEYGELVREGAGGTSFDIARNAPKQNVRSIRLQKNAATKALYTVTNPAQLFRAAENAIGRSEEFNRAIQYFGNKQAALKKGLTVEQAKITAADAARNNTVNFARAGDYGRVVNSALPYLNAGVQGSRTLLRNLKDRPVQTAAKLVTTAFFPTAAITAWNVSDPERRKAYDDIKDYEKQGALIIVPPHPVKDANGKWNVIKIPVSQEVANLNNVVRNGVEAAVKDKSINVAALIGNVAGAATSLNLQSPRQAIGQATPQALKPGVEALTNQNLFTGNQIVPDSQKNLAPKDQIGPGTSNTATKLGRALNLSPRQIDNAVSTTTGGLGKSLIHNKNIQDQVSGRFKGAQGQSSFDKADTTFSALSKQLQKTQEYQKLPVSEKAKALNRLQGTVTSAYNPKKASNGSAKPLSARERAILNNTANLKSYLVAQSPSKPRNNRGRRPGVTH